MGIEAPALKLKSPDDRLLKVQNHITALVTGANGGIGFEVALGLARMNATVTLACRSVAKCTRAADIINSQLRSATPVRTGPVPLDLASLSQVRKYAEWYSAQHGELTHLINNAGVLGILGETPKEQVTSDGYETTFQTNYLGHFLLTEKLLPLLRMQASRVINVASGLFRVAAQMACCESIRCTSLGQMPPAVPPKAPSNSTLAFIEGCSTYGISKYLQILHSKELSRREGRHNISAFSVHPGLVQSRMSDALLGSSMYRRLAGSQGWPVSAVSVVVGAETVLRLATGLVFDESSGAYFELGNNRPSNIQVPFSWKPQEESELYDSSLRWITTRRKRSN